MNPSVLHIYKAKILVISLFCVTRTIFGGQMNGSVPVEFVKFHIYLCISNYSSISSIIEHWILINGPRFWYNESETKNWKNYKSKEQ